MTAPFFAVRGSRPLRPDEFQSHLALAIRLENVAVLLGAGASREVGGHVMADIWKKFSNDAANSVNWLRANRFLPGEGEPNLEVLLDRIEIAGEDLKRTSDTDTGALQLHRHELRKAVLSAGILNADLWTTPEKVLDESYSFRSHLRLISRLIGNRQPGQAAPWIFTTNYDLGVEWAAEALSVYCANGFTGLHNRQFRPSSFELGFRNVYARGEARFGAYNVYLGKLHGSLSWSMEDDGSVIERPSEAMWPRISRFLTSECAENWPGLMIFPGAAKFVQTTGFVYGEIIRRFTEFLSKPNACLITCGYGFADDHINRLIVSGLQNPTLQIIIYLPEVDRFGIYPTLECTGDILEPNILLRRLLAAQLPQVTVRGYGSGAYFSEMTNDLPEPALLDESAERARAIEQLIRGGTNNLLVTSSTAPLDRRGRPSDRAEQGRDE
jgi:hypothetical protein